MPEHHDFSSLLADELCVCQCLFKLLNDEQLAISTQDLENLNKLQPQKQDAMDALRLKTAARQEYMSHHGYNELNDLLNQTSEHEANLIKAHWLKLKNQYQLNRDLSDSLAQVVQQAQWRAQQQLQILCGKSEKSDVYGQDGRPQSHHTGLGMVQA